MDLMQRDLSRPDLPTYVPAGLYAESRQDPEHERYTVTVNRTAPIGTTELVRRVLKNAPMREFLLGEIAQALAITGPRWELGACVCKLVSRREVIKGECKVGAKTLKTYRWRLPSDD